MLCTTSTPSGYAVFSQDSKRIHGANTAHDARSANSRIEVMGAWVGTTADVAMGEVSEIGEVLFSNKRPTTGTTSVTGSLSDAV